MLLTGKNLWKSLTRQFSVRAGIPPGTLLGHKFGNFQSHDIIGDAKSVTQQSTIIVERFGSLWVGVVLIIHPTISNFWHKFLLEIYSDKI